MTIVKLYVESITQLPMMHFLVYTLMIYYFIIHFNAGHIFYKMFQDDEEMDSEVESLTENDDNTLHANSK